MSVQLCPTCVQLGKMWCREGEDVMNVEKFKNADYGAPKLYWRVMVFIKLYFPKVSYARHSRKFKVWPLRIKVRSYRPSHLLFLSLAHS